jgi:hypothetical protein
MMETVEQGVIKVVTKLNIISNHAGNLGYLD